MNLKICSVLLVASLVGCASAPQYEFRKNGATRDEARSAYSGCEYQVLLNKVPQEQQRKLMRLCMEGQGYRLVRVG